LLPDGTTTVSFASGVTRQSLEAPEPRWGMLAPIETELTISTPAGLQTSVEREDSVILTLPGNPLSLLSWMSTHQVDGLAWSRVIMASPDGYSQTTTSPEGREIRRQFDPFGRPVSVQRGDLAPMTMRYDTLGRLTGLAAGEGDRERTATLDYGGGRYLASLTDPVGRVTSFEYDAAGRLTAWILPGDRRLEIRRDRIGAPVAVVTPRGSTHELRRSASGLVSRYIPPPNVGDPAELYAVDYEHDPDRLLDRILWPDGRAVTFEHGCGRRLERATFPGGEITYTYDESRNTVTGVNRSGHASLAVAHDGPLVTRQTWSGAISGRVDRTYTDGFAIHRETVNGAQPVDFGFDGDELLVQAGDLSISRSAANGLVQSTTLGGIVTIHEHDEFGSITRTRAERDGVTFLDVVYQRDLRGRITGTTETIEGSTATWSYSYDVTGRIETAELDAGGTLHSYSYGYDANGNRVNVTTPAGTEAGFFDAQDRLLSLGGTTLTWSLSGQLSGRTGAGGTTGYDHDVFGNLLGADLPDGTRIDYVVDGLHRRVGKRIDGNLVSGFLYRDDLLPAAELDGPGEVVSRFVYGADGVTPSYMISRKEDGLTWRTYRLLTDANGSVRLVVDVDADSLRIVQRIDYSPWGVILTDTRPGFQPFGFAGGLRDPDTRLVRFGRRDYDPRLGQWITRDPLLFTGGDPNLYAYALGDPVNRVDPFGMSSDRAHCREWWRKWWERFLREFARKWRELGKENPYDLGREGQELLEDISDVANALDDLNDFLDEFGLGADLPWPAALVPDMLAAGVEVLSKGTKIFDDYHGALGGLGVHANADGSTSR